MDDKHVAVEDMLKDGGGRPETMSFIEKCSPGNLLESAYEFLVEAYEAIRSGLSAIFNDTILLWKEKVVEFIIDKTVDLIKYITGYTDLDRIKAIIKCTANYILSMSSAIAQNS